MFKGICTRSTFLTHIQCDESMWLASRFNCDTLQEQVNIWLFDKQVKLNITTFADTLNPASDLTAIFVVSVILTAITGCKSEILADGQTS